jgi:drug/metabolite transporter (DMT)-like permease
VAVFLGVLVAACFGSGDFLGGSASRRAPTLTVLRLAQVVALAGAVVFALAFGGHASGHDVVLGALAGGLNVIALGCLYAGLASGRMGVVAPVTAVVAACVPVAWGVADGEHLSPLAVVGVALAISAGGMIAREHDEPDGDAGGGRLPSLALALFAGVLFGSSLVLYSETGHDSGAWPVLAGRASAAVVVLVVAGVVARGAPRLVAPARAMAVGAGLLDVTATALLLLAVREGLVATVAPVAALGPAFTVMWAWRILHEPVGRAQLVGIAVGVAGLVLIAAG